MSRGTSLATEDGVTDIGPGAQWRAQRDRYFLAEAPKTSRLSLWCGLFVQATLLGILFASDYPLWRILALAGGYAGFVLVHNLVLRKTRGTGQVEHAFIMMNVSSLLFVVTSATLTGGVHSPFLPNTLLPSIVSLLFFGPQAASRWIALGNGLLVVAMAMLPVDVVGPELTGTAYAVSILLAIGWNVFLLHMLMGKLTIISARTGASMNELREERLAEAEAGLQRLQSVGAKVAHELKNPLASIKGLCQLVARTPESERTQERLSVVASEISRMETILHEYLSFSRPLEDLKPESIDLPALAQDVCDVLAGRAEQAGVGMIVDGKELRVQGDPRRLKEALINLVANAIEATPTGGSVRLRLRRDRAAVQIEVVDTGRGISGDDLEKLGTSFFTTRPGGTGLGVVLAQGVITQHGGTLAYASQVGRGTTATIRLPGEAAVAPEAGARAAMLEARA
jgi:signal transduction histidine kinase|nr:HAMP domain-containing sensor histidine kinase [Kofleriaceae bacterium]